MRPVPLAPNQPATFYRGSGRLAAFRGADLPDRPEDWIASTTSRFGQAPSGLSTLSDGPTLAAAIDAEPRDWLGPDHLNRHGTDTNLLVKLLDAGQRLPVHAHPGRGFAHSHLNNPHGKTEAWIVLEAAPGAAVYLGFTRDVGRDELAGWVATQDIRAMLAATNRVPVAAGDSLLCPAGTPHAIGADILLVELQEPTDLSVLLEWDGFGLGPADATLGLPMDLALACVDRHAVPPERLAELRGRPDRLLPAEADEFFTATRVEPGATLHGYAVLVVTAGAGELAGARVPAAGWPALPARRGSTFAIPYAAGGCVLSGTATGILCRPGGSPA